MECGICSRHHDAKRQPFLCCVDARSRIYDSRLRQLNALFENEALQSRIHSLLEDTASSSSLPTPAARDLTLAQQRSAEQRTDEILKAAEELRDEIQAAREEIRERKAGLARRRNDLRSVSAGLAERRAKQQRDLEKVIGMARFRWAQSAEDMAATRAFLCTEAVRLYGLRRSSRKGSSGRYEYFLGKVPIVDLTTMDSLPPEVISTSLAHIAHILILLSHYLAIRLPAEITLPHRDYPRPTIFNFQSSYRHGDGPPNEPLANPPLGANSPFQAGFHSHVPRPRPLFIDKPLAQLSKEDPAAYSLFLEGVTLLAYNVSWLCCTQGISVGDKSSFEDTCNLGRNLYGLLLNQRQGPNSLAVHVHPQNMDPPSTQNQNQNQSQNVGTDRNWVGRFSHGTAFYFLGGPEGTEMIKSFKILNPVKLADKLKRRLIGDAPAPDWEVLDDEAWREEAVVGNGPAGAAGAAGAAGFSDKAGRGALETRRNSNGWMKVKNRFS